MATSKRKTLAPVSPVQKAKVNFIHELLKDVKGQIFTVTFIKADNSIREMNCRLGVKKHLKGGESTIKDYNHLLAVYDVKAEGYRSVNLLTVTGLKIRKAAYSFELV